MKKIVLNFKIDNIEINKILINPEPSLFESDKYEYRLDVEHLFNVEESIVMINVGATVFSKRKELLAEVNINIFYVVENIKNFENKKEKKMGFPEDFSIALNSVSISTLRGIMFSQFRGTYLHNAFLPIVNPKSLELAR